MVCLLTNLLYVFLILWSLNFSNKIITSSKWLIVLSFYIRFMLLDLVFPQVCHGCWKSWTYLCFECRKSLKPHPELCPLSHKPSEGYAVRYDLLPHEENLLAGVIVCFRFDPLIKKLILDLKYRHRSHIAWFLGERLALALRSHHLLWPKIESSHDNLIISFVPSHRIRQHISKWYNQAELLANALCKTLGREKPLKLCTKSKHTHSQVGMTKIQRERNLTDAFKVITDIPAWSTIILVDDVLTSWTTLLEISKTIKNSQPQCTIWWLCVARHG